MKKTITLLLLASALSLSAAQTPESQSIDKFFADFTAEWMRANPSAATAARYFTGSEQDRLERQLTPEPVPIVTNASISREKAWLSYGNSITHTCPKSNVFPQISCSGNWTPSCGKSRIGIIP